MGGNVRKQFRDLCLFARTTDKEIRSRVTVYSYRVVPELCRRGQELGIVLQMTTTHCLYCGYWIHRLMTEWGMYLRTYRRGGLGDVVLVGWD